ncbi:hypothetical protein R6Q57_015373 [Mikania cordata]
MEVDEFQKHVSKFQRVSSNGSTTTTDNSSNPQKIAADRRNLEQQNRVDDGGVARLCGWPLSRIVRVSRASGCKDRHSKVLTSKGPRDRRVRLSVNTAIQFYDLQDRLGFDQPSKAVEWLLKAASGSIDELPSLDPPLAGAISVCGEKEPLQNGDENVSQAKSPACSSTSETSKGSGLSLSRSENRIKARERAREMASKKEKEKEIDSARVTVLNQVNTLPENSSFTDLLTGGINTTAITSRSPMDYFFNTGDNNHHHQHQHHLSLFQNSFIPAVTTTTGGGVTGGGETYNLNFAMTSSSSTVAPGGFIRGTLQSNLPSSIFPHHQHFPRFQSSSIDGSTSTNLPFFIVPNSAVDHYPATGGYYGGEGDGGDRRSDHLKDKSKN